MFQTSPAFPTIPSSEITAEATYLNRRHFLRGAGALSAFAALGASGAGNIGTAHAAGITATANPYNTKLLNSKPSSNPAFMVTDKSTPFESAATYNNFYEFGTDKAEPAQKAQKFIIDPWTIQVEGEVLKPRTFGMDELLKLSALEERVYRLRCVEGWSMVIPWVGYSLSELIKAVQPKGNAKFVEFISAGDAKQMPGVGNPVLNWPYNEGLRLDEAMNPLTLLTLGMYGHTLPRQNGAPVRIITPWKYGFKSAKSIVKIRFTERQPMSSWQAAAPREYGFYSNVNPSVDHPRWSQATERRLPDDGIFAAKRKTLMFNGYAEQVGSLYSNLDLRKNF